MSGEDARGSKVDPASRAVVESAEHLQRRIRILQASDLGYQLAGCWNEHRPF